MTAIANALAESFVDRYKTELIADRVWRSHAQLELATVDYLAWFNTRRLHSSLGNVPPVEHEQRHVARSPLTLKRCCFSRLCSPLNRSGVYDPSGVVSAPRC